MFETNGSLIPPLPAHLERKQQFALLLGFDKSGLDEMKQLLSTLSLELAGEESIQLRSIQSSTYLGKGKIEELKEKYLPDEGQERNSDKGEQKPVDLVVFDSELTPMQVKNLEKIFQRPCLDRAGIILEIFSQNAKTKEAKTQVELARLQYLLPRLAHLWTHFERQKGGIGLKGMGEKQIEVDRRLLKKRIYVLKDKLIQIEKERNVQRVGRKDFLKVALVGYTNAGKSTLLNELTRSHALAEDKLFATLDSQVRLLNPDSHPPVVAIDTVGFIDRIPPGLIASFRSTLEELHQADLLLHVVDASSLQAKEQMLTTQKILAELGLEEKPTLIVLNKIDRIKRGVNLARIVAPGSLRISALNPEDVRKLRTLILGKFQESLENWEVLIPYSESKLDAQLHQYGVIEINRFLEKGTYYRLKIDGSLARRLNLMRYRTLQAQTE